MLKKILTPFYEAINAAREKHGESPAKIADEIMRAVFPDTVESAETEGCDKMLRQGIVGAVKSYIKKPPEDERQSSFADVDPDFLPYVQKLQNTRYFVPDLAGGEFKHIADLIARPAYLDAARKFQRLKGEETLEEADRLDELYAAVTEGQG